MTTVSCIIVTTLIVVSLANLILLVHVIMHSMMNKCDQKSPSKKITKTHKRQDFFVEEPTTLSNHNYKFIAALVVLYGDDNNFKFVCGAAMVSKKWVLTAARCVEAVLEEPKENVKISSNASKLKYGIWFDVEEIVVHEKYKPAQYANNVALISIQKNFKEKEVTVAFLPSGSYKYLANTTATAVGWSGVEIFSNRVKLLQRKDCQSSFFGKISDAAFCAEKKNCIFDYSGFLVQKDLLVGVISFGSGCGPKPVVYTKISVFEDWFKRYKIGGIFKENY